MISHPQSRSLAIAMMLVVVFIAAVGWLFSKQGIGYFEPFQFMALRFSVGAALLVLILPRLHLNSEAWKAAGWVAIPFTLGMVFWIQALALSDGTGIGLGGFIITSGVVLSPLVGRLFYGEALPRGFWIALALALAGGVLLAPGLEVTNFSLYVAASTCLAFYMTALTRQSRRHSAATLTIPMFGLMALTMGSLSLITESPQWDVPIQAWGWLCLSGAFATALRFYLQSRFQGELTQTESSMIMNLESLWVALLTIAFMGAALTSKQWIGGGMVMVASGLVMLRKQGPALAKAP